MKNSVRDFTVWYSLLASIIVSTAGASNAQITIGPKVRYNTTWKQGDQLNRQSIYTYIGEDDEIKNQTIKQNRYEPTT